MSSFLLELGKCLSKLFSELDQEEQLILKSLANFFESINPRIEESKTLESIKTL
jgi:hypothetical protein